MNEESVLGIVERLRRWDEYNCVHLPSHTVDLTDEAADHIERLTSALERLDRNFKFLLSGKPVRDVAETDAEVREALYPGGVDSWEWYEKSIQSVHSPEEE